MVCFTSAVLVGCGSSPKKRDAATNDARTDTGGGGGDVAVDAPARGEVGDVPAAADLNTDAVVAEVADAPRVDAEVAVTPEVAPDVPSAPDLAPDLPIDRPITGQPNGAPCTSNSNCRTNFCVDLVCCENACNNGCSACTMAKTGLPDGRCAADRPKAGQVCGTYCAQLAANAPAVLKKICTNGQCVASTVLTQDRIQEVCQREDRCITSFCEDNTAQQSARCVHIVCQQQGTCCCGSATIQRTCVQRTACMGDRSCS